MSPVRWGVLSTSEFAAGKFLPGLRKSSAIEVVAVASRDAENAAKYASANAIPISYGSYEALLADPSIEIIYNPLPNHLHVEWTLKAAEAGKHVLCEKPMGIDAASLESLRVHTDRVHIEEAFMVRHHSQWTIVRDLVRSGGIGELTHAHIAFSYSNRDPANIRNIAALGGGALYDIGCYAVVAARWFFDAEIVRAVSLVDRDPDFGTDRRTSGLLDLGAGRTVQFTVSTQSAPHQRVHLFGTTGRIEITIPFNQPQHAPTVYLTHDGSTLDGLDTTAHVVPVADQYQLLGEWFSAKVRNEQPTAAGLDDSIRTMAVLDALFRSEHSARFEPVRHPVPM